MFYMIKRGRLIKYTTDISLQYEAIIGQSMSLFIGDILLAYFVLWRKVGLYSRRSMYHYNRTVSRSETTVFNTFKLRCLLMKSAIERLTAVRHVMSRDYNLFITMVTSDYDAMYAYKCGEYERCLHLCQQNVNSLLDVIHATSSFALPSTDLLLLMDDDCLSLVGLCVLGDVYNYGDGYQVECVSQLSLSLYLLVQCKLKLKHPSKSFIDACRNIKLVYRRIPVTRVTDYLLLTLACRRAIRRILR